MDTIRIYGYGGFAREVAAAISQQLNWTGNALAGFMVDDEYYQNQPYCIPVSQYSGEDVILAVGDPGVRWDIFRRFQFLNYIGFNSGTMLGECEIGTGSIIQPGTILTVNVKLGMFVIVNLNCTIGHDSEISDFTTISPGVNISGNVKIGKFCYIGSNAVIREKITICDNVIIGAGAVVVKDITEPGTYIGNPAKLIKHG